MISQNADAIGYISSIPEREAASPRVLREGVASGAVFRNVIWVIGMILFPVALAVLLSGANAEEEYRMQGIRHEVMTMAKENAVMKLEVSRLEAPVRVQQIAETKLGMSLPLRAVYGGADPVVPDENRGR